MPNSPTPSLKLEHPILTSTVPFYSTSSSAGSANYISNMPRRKIPPPNTFFEPFCSPTHGLLILRYPKLESRELHAGTALVSGMGPVSSSAGSASSLAEPPAAAAGE